VPWRCPRRRGILRLRARDGGLRHHQRRLAVAHSNCQPDRRPGATASAIEAHLLVQQGLAIGLASNVVQSQVTVLMDALLDDTSCKALEAGTGSSKVLQRSTTGNITTVSVDVYYDASCAQPYIEAAAQLSSSAATSTISITETATYLGGRSPMRPMGPSPRSPS
jgi:hypothetical protein